MLRQLFDLQIPKLHSHWWSHVDLNSDLSCFLSVIVNQIVGNLSIQLTGSGLISKSLCNLCVLCVSVVGIVLDHFLPQRHREHGGRTKKTRLGHYQDSALTAVLDKDATGFSDMLGGHYLFLSANRQSSKCLLCTFDLTVNIVTLIEP